MSKHHQGPARVAGALIGAMALVGAVGCTRMPTGPTGPSPTYVATTMPGMDHGDGGMDHGGGGGPSTGGHHVGYDHPPTEAQQAAARQLIADTRAAAQRQGLTTLAGLIAKGYISIGDEVTGTTHYVKPSFHYDGKELNPNAIEAFAVRLGRPVAAMYILENGKGPADIPDVAGSWTEWHRHTNLTWRSNNPRMNGYYQIGGLYYHATAPMLHVWLQRNACGPFAGTDTGNMTGSCNRDIE